MDFGVLGLQPVVAHHHHHPQSSSSSSPEQQQPSSVLPPPPPPPPPPDSNLQRSDVVCCKPSKIPRTSTMSAGLLRSNSSSNMLSFSSTPYHHHYPPAPNTPGSLSGTMHGAAFNGFRGPFTPSQWMELEHQALIYKYLTANVAVPSNLLNPLKKSLYPFALSSSSSPASFIPGSLGWGAFHLGYPGSTNDPEPGRCRRTDGKKWRCSRDAVSDQKYCERHINRGRHRSRKPVEGQSGHGVSGTKLVVVPPPPQQQQQQQMAASTSAITTNSAAAEQQQLKNLQLQHQQANASRFGLSKVNEASNGRLQVDSPLMSVPKQNVQMDSSRHHQSEFGVVSYDSLLNPSQQGSTTSCYPSFLSFGDQDTQDQHSLHQFMDNDWHHKDGQSSRNVISWPEELKSDWTQLSMSIPMAPSDFSSSSSSPAHEKLALSPWGGGGGGGSSMGGGPLGEVLTTKASGSSSFKSSSALNLLTEEGCWDGSSTSQLGFSPTGVLQKATFASQSNSSTGSSPRGGDSKRNNSLCNDLLGSNIVSSSTTPVTSL